MKQQMRNWAEQAKALFPEDATLRNGKNRRQAIEEQLQDVLSRYDETDKSLAKTQASMFLSKMNAAARVAYRRKFQSEIVEIK